MESERLEFSTDERVRRSGNSFVVTLTPAILQIAGVAESDAVELAAADGAITLERKGQPD